MKYFVNGKEVTQSEAQAAIIENDHYMNVAQAAKTTAEVLDAMKHCNFVTIVKG